MGDTDYRRNAETEKIEMPTLVVASPIGYKTSTVEEELVFQTNSDQASKHKNQATACALKLPV